MSIKLLPNGFIDGFPSNEELDNCPWFWSKKRQTWVNRPEYRPYSISGSWNEDVQRMIKENDD